MAKKDYPPGGARDTQQPEGVGLEAVCGAHSALGLDEVERVAWPHLRERLRRPDRLMALMRGVLGGDAEVAVVAAVTPEGVATPLALLVSPGKLGLSEDQGLAYRFDFLDLNAQLVVR